MSPRAKILFAILILCLLGFGFLAWALLGRGFSAREEPSRLEEFLARRARKIATPARAKELKNPHSLTAENADEVRAHWVDHCAMCHALDGSGNTAIGRNLYPRAPDLRDATTQGLSDGELFYIINNGVRFTGMPAWEAEHSPEATWLLVSFIRRLPSLTPEELKELEKLAGKAGPEAGEEHKPSPPHKH